MHPDLLNADLFRLDPLTADLLRPHALDCSLADPPPGNPTLSGQPLHLFAPIILVPTISFYGHLATATSLPLAPAPDMPACQLAFDDIVPLLTPLLASL